MGLECFRVGTLCSGTFCSWDVSRLRRFVLGRFVGAPLKACQCWVQDTNCPDGTSMP